MFFYPLFPGGAGLQGALGFESPLLLGIGAIRPGLEPGLGRLCGLL